MGSIHIYISTIILIRYINTVLYKKCMTFFFMYKLYKQQRIDENRNEIDNIRNVIRIVMAAR